MQCIVALQCTIYAYSFVFYDEYNDDDDDAPLTIAGNRVSRECYNSHLRAYFLSLDFKPYATRAGFLKNEFINIIYPELVSTSLLKFALQCMQHVAWTLPRLASLQFEMT